MAYGVRLKVWGEFASFNRPEMKVERVSYDVITPSAARGIVEAIYWKPEMRWIIDRLHVLKPIRFTHVRRNEINSKISGKRVEAVMKKGEGRLGMAVEDHRQQRAAMILRDVCYGIEAHVDIIQDAVSNGTTLKKPEGKHLDIFKRRAAKGQYFHHPYLGTREFPAHFELVDSFPSCPEELLGDEPKDLGFMLHDIAFEPDPEGKIVDSNRGRRLSAQPRFFRAMMINGVIKMPPLEQAKA